MTSLKENNKETNIQRYVYIYYIYSYICISETVRKASSTHSHLYIIGFTYL